MLNVMSVDVEEYFQTEMMSRVITRSAWKTLPTRVETNTRRLYELFERHRVKATFFFLGWVAEQHPGLVREAVKLGHEVACHSYWHRQVHTISPEEFREDTKRAKGQIEDISGSRVLGYRAPSFSMTRGSEWAFEILGELGFLYDSSVHPIRHDLYGNPTAPREPNRVGSTRLLEIPISTIRLASNNYPFSGGGYFRLFPYPAVRWAIQRLNRKESKAAVFYIHPWEIDKHPPKLTDNRKINFRQNLGIGRTYDALSRMVRDFEFASISQVFARDLCAGAPDLSSSFKTKRNAGPARESGSEENVFEGF